jgi:regulatory protein
VRRAQPLSLKGRALQWLAQREHSRVELRGKLKAHLDKQRRLHAARTGDTSRLEARALHSPASTRDMAAPIPGTAPDFEALEASIEPLLDELESKGHLSDRRFAESRVRQRSAKMGLTRIRAEVEQRGGQLDADLVASLRESEYARARDLWARRWGGEVATVRDERLRQMRFLAARGFPGEVVRRVVEGR